MHTGASSSSSFKLSVMSQLLDLLVWAHLLLHFVNGKQQLKPSREKKLAVYKARRDGGFPAEFHAPVITTSSNNFFFDTGMTSSNGSVIVTLNT